MSASPATPRIRSRRSLHLALAVALPLVLVDRGGDASAPRGSDHEHPSASTSSAPRHGVRTTNGYRTINGLRALGRMAADAITPAHMTASSALLSTAAGRATASYLVRCALPAGRSITRPDAHGQRHTFHGQLGLAPEWESGTCGTVCQEWISACMLSMVNTTGTHVPVWMLANHPAIGRGASEEFPHQEGAFFGNLFTEPPQAFYCRGRDYAHAPAPGRIGSGQVNAPYVDAFASLGGCQQQCQHAADGDDAAVDSCASWDRVVTIYRQ